MKLTSSLAGLEMIRILERVEQRWNMTVSGVPGWYWESPLGLCIALAIERVPIDDEWLVRTSLWLASIPESLDDSLLLEGGHIFLVRRYEFESSPAELEARVQQQVAVVCWFATQGDTHEGSNEASALDRLV